jgi:hypothetical protein
MLGWRVYKKGKCVCEREKGVIEGLTMVVSEPMTRSFPPSEHMMSKVHGSMGISCRRDRACIVGYETGVDKV